MPPRFFRPDPPQAAAPATTPDKPRTTIRPPSSGRIARPSPDLDLTPHQHAAVEVLVRSGAESPPADMPSTDKLRWFRTMGSLVTRGLAMQDGQTFLPTRYARALFGIASVRPSIAIALLAGPPPRVPPRPPVYRVGLAGAHCTRKNWLD